eukprot:12633779-Alexandrium_andersonii.AAC.1
MPGIREQLETPSFSTQTWGRRVERGAPRAGPCGWGSPAAGGLQAFERAFRPCCEAWTAASSSWTLVPDP